MQPERDQKWDSSHRESHLRLSLDTPTGFVSNYFAYDFKTQDFCLLMISTRKDLTVSFCMIVPTGEAVEPSLMISTRKDLSVSFCMIVPTGEAVEPSLSYSCTGIVRFQRCHAKSRVSFNQNIRFNTILWIVQYHLRVTTNSYMALKQTIR